MQKYHFISGLPRSGSTLLSAILQQNPRFSSGISDPVLDILKSTINTVNTAAGMTLQVPDDKLLEILKSIVSTFYRDDNEVCFNTNRLWTANTTLLKQIYPSSKVIVCVRDVPWILDSFERLNSNNPLTVKPIYHHQPLTTVYERSSMLMGEYANHPGFVVTPLLAAKQAVYSAESDMLCVVDYEKLTSDPLGTMKQIYEFIGEPWYEHDFENLEYSYDEFDEAVRINGLHTVRPKVEVINRRPVIPEDIWIKYMNTSFWKEDGFDRIKRRLNWID